jgi:hypothetical protein
VLPVRRIATDLREVRWGHVFIELMLLVVGILIAQALSRLMGRRTLRLTHATYSSLVSTGNIRLIRNAGGHA